MQSLKLPRLIAALLPTLVITINSASAQGYDPSINPPHGGSFNNNSNYGNNNNNNNNNNSNQTAGSNYNNGGASSTQTRPHGEFSSIRPGTIDTRNSMYFKKMFGADKYVPPNLRTPQQQQQAEQEEAARLQQERQSNMNTRMNGGYNAQWNPGGNRGSVTTAEISDMQRLVSENFPVPRNGDEADMFKVNDFAAKSFGGMQPRTLHP